MTVIKFGALILYAGRFEKMIAFYRTLGLPLESEQHDPDEAVHYACEIGPVHFAIYEAKPGVAPNLHAGGSATFGWEVPSLVETAEALRTTGAKVIREPEDRPWGRRMLVEDPDGRTVEIWSQAH